MQGYDERTTTNPGYRPTPELRIAGRVLLTGRRDTQPGARTARGKRAWVTSGGNPGPVILRGILLANLAGRFGRVGLAGVAQAGDEHRALRVTHTLLGDRSEHELAERAAAAVPHHE